MSNVYVLIDDWGWDGQHLLSVSRTMELAETFAAQHARLEGRNVVPNSWKAIKNDILLADQNAWTAVSDSDRRYIIREMKLL